MVNHGQRPIVGMNCYETGEEMRSNVFKVDEEVERIAVERVKQLRATRDAARHERAMKRLTEAVQAFAERDLNDLGNHALMPAAIDAARADATTGEIMGVLKGALGWGAPHEY